MRDMPSDRDRRVSIGRRHLASLVQEGYFFGGLAVTFGVVFLILFLAGANPIAVGGAAAVVLTVIAILWPIRASIRKAKLEQDLREV